VVTLQSEAPAAGATAAGQRSASAAARAAVVGAAALDSPGAAAGEGEQLAAWAADAIERFEAGVARRGAGSRRASEELAVEADGLSAWADGALERFDGAVAAVRAGGGSSRASAWAAGAIDWFGGMGAAGAGGMQSGLSAALGLAPQDEAVASSPSGVWRPGGAGGRGPVLASAQEGTAAGAGGGAAGDRAVEGHVQMRPSGLDRGPTGAAAPSPPASSTPSPGSRPSGPSAPRAATPQQLAAKGKKVDWLAPGAPAPAWDPISLLQGAARGSAVQEAASTGPSMVRRPRGGRLL
jgi:hypothetical protein